MAKSLPQAGNVNLRGKKQKMMRCLCCVCQNLKPEILAKAAKKEMRDAMRRLDDEADWWKPD